MSNRNNGGHGGSAGLVIIPANQDQGQSQHEGQAQGQLEAQLQAQGEAQGQGQGQGQYQSSTSENSNGNESYNGNESFNGSLNGNLNGNLNYNESTTHVTVDVGVTADVSPSEAPAEAPAAPAFNLSDFSFSSGNLVVMPDFGIQTTGEGGHNFHLDQVNSLVDNDSLGSPVVSLSVGGIGGGDPDFGSGTGAGFNFGQAVSAANTGSSSVNLDDHSTSSAISSAASAANEAFTQHITMGANIQYNSMSVVGGDSSSDIHHDAGSM